MKYFWMVFFWIWARKVFFGLTLISALFFFALFFPFSDLSDAVTSAISRGTNNQIYLQADKINIHLIPVPALSATNLSVETTLPRIEAKWAKVTPSLFSVLFNLPTVIKASRGDAEASRALMSRIGIGVDAEGILGGDLTMRLRSGSKSEQGRERSRVSLAVDGVSLKDVQQWADVNVPMNGKASVDTDIAYVPDFQEQPEGEFEMTIEKFNIPASTISIPMGEASFPLSVPNITLANVRFKGRLVGGNLIIEEGVFGQNKDPLYGRIKGQMGLMMQAAGPNIVPIFGSYSLNVELNTTASIQKDLGFAFMLLDSAKEATGGGAARYLFRASGQGVGINYPPPQITRVNSF